NLPPIPIPNFSGDIWEWEAFWREFEHSVHLRQMDDRLKMNYLQQNEISRESYPIVTDHLKGKYGNKQAFINQL
ncbi:hypothetical protein Angca_001035, partial [Angiostrongylus cantonensis]